MIIVIRRIKELHCMLIGFPLQSKAVIPYREFYMFNRDRSNRFMTDSFIFHSILIINIDAPLNY